MKNSPFIKSNFHKVVDLPSNYEVFDFTVEDKRNKNDSNFVYGVGRYNEKRPNMYLGELYIDQRDIHVGIDLMVPEGSPVYAFDDGEIFCFTYNDMPLDYGYTIITKHLINNNLIYALHGHLNKKSIDNKKVGDRFSKGDTIAWIGSSLENGGWKPHLHFQISIEEPKVCDMPGVVHEKDRVISLEKYPDPRLILGPLY